MAPTTDRPRSAPGDVAEFYDWLAPEYDVMTEFERRFAHETPFFRLLVERHRLRSAVDAGAGTGFHSLLLAQLGVSVTAVDLSPEMIERLMRHAHSRGLAVHGVAAPFDRLPGLLAGPVDAVFCMGNTLAHCLTHEELLGALRSFASVLRPGGVLFVQVLNYDRILERKEPIQSVKEIEGKTFIRYYEYHSRSIRFNILKLEREGGTIRHSLRSIELRPLPAEELSSSLEEAGFTGATRYGGITLEDFVPTSSRDLAILARRGA